MQGHEELGAQEAVASLVGPRVQALALPELAHTHIHHARIHLHMQSRVGPTRGHLEKVKVKG